MIENKLWKIGNYVVAVKHGKYGFNKDKALFEPELGTITKITNVATDANSIRADGLGQHIYFSKDYVEPFSNFEDAEKYSKRIKIYKNKKFYTKKEDLENKSYFVDIDINFLYYTSFKFNNTICCTNKTLWRNYTVEYESQYIYVELSKEEEIWFNKCINAGKYLEKDSVSKKISFKDLFTKELEISSSWSILPKSMMRVKTLNKSIKEALIIDKLKDKFIIERPKVPDTENTVYYFKSKSLINN